MITPLNRLTTPPENPDQAREALIVADLAAQLVLDRIVKLEQIAGDQTEAATITLFAQMRAQERTPHTEYQGSRPLKPSELFQIAFIESLPK